MTVSKGNGEFCFPETLNVPWGEVLIDRLEAKVGYDKWSLGEARLYLSK